jgi:hypothetical protein
MEEHFFKEKTTTRHCYKNTVFLRFIELKNLLSNRPSKVFIRSEPWKIGLNVAKPKVPKYVKGFHGNVHIYTIMIIYPISIITVPAATTTAAATTSL